MLTSIAIFFVMSNGFFRSFTSSLDSVCQFVDNYFAINTLLTIHFGRVMFLDRFDLGVHVHLEEVFTIVLHFVSKSSCILFRSLGNS